MLKKLIKHENSNALIIDKSILDILNIGTKTILKIKTDGKSIIITPIDKGKLLKKVSDDPKVQKAFEEVLEEYASALEKLAKN